MNVHKRSNTYQYDFYYEGKRYRKGGFLTKREAKIAMTIKHSNLIDGFELSNQIAFVTYYRKWLEVTKLGVIHETSYNRYITAIKVFEDCFGNIPINEIDLLSYRAFLRDYGQGYYLNHGVIRPRSTNTVSKLNNCLNQAFESAIEQGLIKRNPCKNANPRGVKASQSIEDKFMTLSELKSLIKHVKNKPYLSYLYIYILIITGSRFKPVQRLRYDHLDFENSRIYLDDRKNIYSARFVKVRKEDLDYIQSIIDLHDKNQNGYIFHNKINFINYSTVNKVVSDFCLNNGLQKYTLKSLRHTHCSYLLAKGVSTQYISKRLGHADIHTTIKIYSHLIKEFESEEDKEVVNYLNEFFL